MAEVTARYGSNTGRRGRRPRLSGGGLRLDEPRKALLVDLDNFAIVDGELQPRPAVLAGLREVLRVVGPVQHRLVVAPQRTIERFVLELQDLQLPWRVVPQRPDAADEEIAAVARELCARGYRKLVVVSCDHYFVALARECELTVIAPAGKRVARSLAVAAGEVVHVQCHGITPGVG